MACGQIERLQASGSAGSTARGCFRATYWSAAAQASALARLGAQSQAAEEYRALELMVAIERLRMRAAQLFLEQVWGERVEPAPAAA